MKRVAEEPKPSQYPFSKEFYAGSFDQVDFDAPHALECAFLGSVYFGHYSMAKCILEKQDFRDFQWDTVFVDTLAQSLYQLQALVDAGDTQAKATRDLVCGHFENVWPYGKRMRMFVE